MYLQIFFLGGDAELTNNFNDFFYLKKKYCACHTCQTSNILEDVLRLSKLYFHAKWLVDISKTEKVMM